MVRGLLTVEVVAVDREEVACLVGAVEGLVSADLDVVIGDIGPIVDVSVKLRHIATSACNVIDKPTHIINEDVATVGDKLEGIAENIDRHHILSDDVAAVGSLINGDCNLDVDPYAACDDHSRSKGGVVDTQHRQQCDADYKAIDVAVNIGDDAVVTGYSHSSIATIIVANPHDKHISLWVVGLAFLMVGVLKTISPDVAFSHLQHFSCCKPKNYLDAAIANGKTDCCSTIDDAHCFWLSPDY